MKVVVIADFGAEPKLIDLPVPEPGPGQLLVRLHAAGLNPFDWKVADGALKGVVPHAFPLVMGSDGAGVVERIGPGVTAFRPGDRVYGQFMRVAEGFGSYAEYTLAAADGKIARIPEGLPFEVAAALPTASATAYQAIQAAGLDKEHVILINGASGGVGQSAVQFAANAGARVLATGTSEVAGHLRDLGAHQVIDFTQAPTPDQVRQTHPDGIDAVLDLVSTPGREKDITGLLRPGGTYLSTNGAADTDHLTANGIRGVNVSSSPTPNDLATLARLADSGQLRVRIDATVPLEEAPAAVARSRAGHSRGKTVILP